MSHNFAERTSPYTKFVRDVPGRKSEQRMVGNGDSSRWGSSPATSGGAMAKEGMR